MRIHSHPTGPWRRPVWIKGRLYVASTNGIYGQVSFMMRGDSAEPYGVPDDG